MSEARYLSRYYATERQRAGDLTAVNQKHDTWGGYRDSPLLGPSETFSFDNSLRRILPSREYNIKEYIEGKLAPKRYRRALELGGRGSQVFAGFTDGFFDETFAVSMDAPERSLRDIERNHTIIPGNMLTKEVQDKVREAHNGEGVDLILLRMMFGQQCLPADPFFMSEFAQFAYEQLASGGIMLVELPAAFFSSIHGRKNLMRLWQDYISELYSGQLEVRYLGPFLRLEKLEGAPEHLPLLPVRVVLDEEIRSLHLREERLREHLVEEGESPDVIEKIIQERRENALL